MASQHTLKLGNKDFTNTYVYAIVDGAKDVALASSCHCAPKPISRSRFCATTMCCTSPPAT